MAGNPQVIYSAAGAAQAHLLAGALRERGFAAMVLNDSLQAATGALPFGTASAPQVVVPECEAEAARQIALELMHEQPPEPRPFRFQFRMRTLLYVVTAVAVYLGIARLTGWQLIADLGTIIYAAICFLLLMAFVPKIVRRRIRREIRRRIKERRRSED